MKPASQEQFFPYHKAPSLEKLADVKEQRDNAEIQLMAVLMAVDGFCKKNPVMTIVEFNELIPTILKFAREAEAASKKGNKK